MELDGRKFFRRRMNRSNSGKTKSRVFPICIAAIPIFPLLPLIFIVLNFISFIIRKRKLTPVYSSIFLLLIFLPGAFTEDYGAGTYLHNLLRFLLVSSLIWFGFNLKEDIFDYLGIGIFIICCICFFFYIAGNSSDRLSFVFVSSTSIGIGATMGIIMTYHSKVIPYLYKLICIIFLLACLILSGSRISMMALIILILFSLANKPNRRGIILASPLAIIFLILITVRGASDSSRIPLWIGTIDIIKQYTLFGTGAYQVGSYYYAPTSQCQWFPYLESRGIECPQALNSINNMWFLSHNGLLQLIAEYGILISSILIILISQILLISLKKGNARFNKTILVLVIANLTDDTIIPPSSFAAEIFWIMLGYGAKNISLTDLKTSILNTSPLLPFLSLSSMISLPLTAFITINKTGTPPLPPKMIHASQQNPIPKQTLWINAVLPQNLRYIVIKSCNKSCRVLGFIDFSDNKNVKQYESILEFYRIVQDKSYIVADYYVIKNAIINIHSFSSDDE